MNFAKTHDSVVSCRYGFIIVGRAVLEDSEDIKSLNEKVGEVDVRMYQVGNVIPELTENIKALTKDANQAEQDEFNCIVVDCSLPKIILMIKNKICYNKISTTKIQELLCQKSKRST